MIESQELTARRNGPAARTRTGWRPRLISTAFIICAACGLNACSVGEEEPSNRPPATTPAAPGSNAPKSQPGPKVSIKAVTASGTAQGNSAAKNVIDNDVTTQWSAGGSAPQWIQLDLGEEMTVSKIRLLTSQTPAGATIHQISAGTAPDKLDSIGTLDANTQDNQWLELALPQNNIRYLKINTVKSPSWTAWREIEIVK
jgi:hypothetical protein